MKSRCQVNPVDAAAQVDIHQDQIDRDASVRLPFMGQVTQRGS